MPGEMPCAPYDAVPTGRGRCERPAPPTSHTVAAPSTPCTHRTLMRIQNACFVHLSSTLMFCKFAESLHAVR